MAEPRSAPASTCSRRLLLGGMGLAMPGIARAAPRLASPSGGDFPADVMTLIVAGPSGGRLDDWSELLARVLGRSLPPGTAIRRQPSGGPDGVTGANQFDARASPDGATLLLLPGDAPLARLAGDPRARFEQGGWIPVIAGVSAGVVCTRLQAPALRPGAPLRIAAGRGPASVELAALLAVDLLGLTAVPVYGLGEAAAADAALAAHAVDAVFVTGSDMPRRTDGLAASGARPLLALDYLDEDGRASRDPFLPDVPSLSELARALRGRDPSGPLFAAWRAVAAVARMQFALVLPQLTPAAIVAVWQRAGAEAAGSPELQALAAGGLRSIASPGPDIATRGGVLDAGATLALREWLATRFNWQPA